MGKTNYLSEMKFIKDWCITVLDFMVIKSPDLKGFSEITKNTLLSHYSQNNKNIFNGFKEGYRDINNMAKMLPLNDYTELNKILIEKYGRGFEDIDNKTIEAIDKIIKRGEILNDEEYRLLEDRANEITQKDYQSLEMKTINKLLFNYYKKKG